MQATFPVALQYLLQHEGGYVENPSDPGGATNQGITLATYRRYYGSDQTKETLRAITTDRVEYLYRVAFWDQCGCPHLPTGVDYVVFDQAVNSGIEQSIRWLQQAACVKADGVLGDITLMAVRRTNPVTLIEGMCRLRLSFMQRLRNGTLWTTFGKGWKRRVNEVRDQGISLTMRYQ